MKNLTILLSLMLMSATAEAASLKGGYPACLSEELFDQFIRAQNEKDKRGMAYLLTTGCVVTKSGIEISVLDTTWTGKAKVRAYTGTNAFILWTNVENVQR